MSTTYGISRTTSLTPADAEDAIRRALADVGFGILTEIDVAATLKEKLDVDRRPYKILGACNPALANQALEAEEAVGLLLPCNVVVYEAEDGSVVAALDPGTMVDITGNDALAGLAREAESLLSKALDALPR